MLMQNFEIEQTNTMVICTPTVAKMTGPESQELIDALTERMRYDNASLFILNMAKVEFMSSACLGILVGFIRDLEHVRGRLALCGCDDNVAFLFKVTGLDNIMSLYADVDEAKIGIMCG